MRTKIMKQEERSHEWFMVDVADKVLGRVAAHIAVLLRGKNRRDFTPHVDSGAGVIVLNCDKVRVTGNKAEKKIYKRYSGYPGGLKETIFKHMKAKSPEYIVWHAVRGMLPKNKLGARMLSRLKLYKDEKHPHAAQKPQVITI